MRAHICYVGYIRAYTECSLKTDMIVSLQLGPVRAPAHMLDLVVKSLSDSLSRSVCTAKQVPRPESWHVALTFCLRQSVAGHQGLLQSCCAWLRGPPEPPCEVHPRLFPLHCTSTLIKWDTCAGCAHPHYPSGIHIQAVYLYRLLYRS